MSGRIASIAVAGGGIVGLSAALAFARALPGTTVRLIDLEPDPAALTDRMPGTLPSFRSFHRLTGIEEAELVQQAGSTHRLGTRFEQWSADGSAWLHCFGDHGTTLQASPFQHQWARANQAGRARPFHSYSPAAALAAAAKFVHPSEDKRSLLASFDYGLRLDPPLYRERLLHHARAAGVDIRQGELVGVEREAERNLAALRLGDGTKVEADLFLDCAGPSAPLLTALDDSFEDWSEFLPCDRFFIAEGPPRPASPLDVAEATPYGWRFALPLPSRTLVGAGFASSFTDEEEVRSNLGLDGQCVAIRPGRRPRPWIGNVLALGDAGVALDPLEATNLHLAESAIRRALSLLPGPDFHPLVLEEYNRRNRLDADRVRDFIAVHYVESRRTQGPFWTDMARRGKPESLAHMLEQFKGRGRIPAYEEESFSTDSWLAVLFGLGVHPKRIDPTAYRVKLEESVAAMERMAQTAAALPAQLPSYRDYLARLTPA